tara:strand:+ start:313 stop:1029 length:717 start_codon:yes stop_codon:yes gene_type:complete
MSQMEIPYLLNNSPMLHGDSQAGEHWASYELNGKKVDHEPGQLGKIRVHDDYWNISDEDKKWYNYDVRNTMDITTEQLDGLLNIIENKSIAVLLHAQNYQDIWKWSRAKPVIMIKTAIDEWDGNIVNWAAREYNTLMEDDTNNNYSGYDHTWPGVHEIVKEYNSKKLFNNEVDENCPGDIVLNQSQWSTLEGLSTLWNTVGINDPDMNWIHQYYDDFQNHQEINKELAMELNNAYNQR